MRKMQKTKVVLAVTILILGIFMLTACTKNVEDEAVTVNFQDAEYAGQYTGVFEGGKPNGEGTFEYKDGDDYLSYEGSFKEGKFSGKGNLKTNLLKVEFSYLDEPRKGTFEGEVVDGIPEGEGTFTAVNDDKEKYTYTGAWKDGLWDGQGKQVFENGKYMNDEGNFEKGEFCPTVPELIISLGTYKELEFTPSDKAKEFMEKHENLFPAQKLSLTKKYTDSKILYKHINKNPDSYGDKVMKLSNYQVVQIFESEYDKYTLTEIIAQNSDYDDCIFIAYPGKKKNLYEDDIITVYGLPLDTTSWENTGGGTTIAIALAGSYIIKE